MKSRAVRGLFALVLSAAAMPAAARAQAPSDTTPPSQESGAPDSVVKRTTIFAAGAMTGFLAHEAGHFVFDVAFDAEPRLRRVEFHGVPFFALTHKTLSPRREAIVASAGFWVQHATSEWILTRRPHIRRERAPFAKGVLAFNVVTSIAYAGTAFAKAGPYERDTRALAEAARVDECWVGAMVLAPAVLDTWRYLDPDSKVATWTSRAAKVGMLFLVMR